MFVAGLQRIPLAQLPGEARQPIIGVTVQRGVGIERSQN
jgi:hypothetical protein